MAVCSICGNPRKAERMFCSRTCANINQRMVWNRSNPAILRKIVLQRSKMAGDCWLWVGGKNHEGYGVLHINGRLTRAHRASYIAFKGDIPADRIIMHTCDNPTCVNPEHLLLGTHKNNSDDKIHKGRHCNRKLTEGDVEIIRKYDGTIEKIAIMFGVSASTIARIKCGRIWV